MRHTTIWMAFCLLLGMSATAQQTLPNWEFEVELAPSLYQYDFTLEEGPYIGYFINGKKLNGDIGLQAWKKISPRLQLGTGLRYSFKDPGSEFYCHVCLFPGPMENVRVPNRYLEVPIGLRFFPLAQPKLYLEAALSGQVNVDGEGSERMMSQFAQVLAGSRLGVGYRLPLAERASLHFGAGFRQDFDFNPEQKATRAGYAKFAFSVSI